MTTSWDSLYLPFTNQNAVVAALKTALSDLGYQLYNPFGIIPGKSYKRAVRLFVAPVANGWVRATGTPDPRLLLPLSKLAPCLHIALDDDIAVIEAYTHGETRPPDKVLAGYLHEGRTLSDLQHALTGDTLAEVESESNSGVFDHLPEDIQALTGQVNMQQAEKMFDQMSGTLMKKVGGSSDAARDLISGSTPDWNSPGGRRIRAVMHCLTVPDHWQEPDFATLRDAYQLHARRQRKPDARLYPGDEETMARVPDALDFIPVYGGQDD